MRSLLPLLLTASLSCQADMLQALQAYQQQDFGTAASKFTELLPLGNEVASFNLAAMALNGEGQPKNTSKALTYLMLAAELKHPQAAALLQKLSTEASAAELQQAEQQFQQLQQQVKINIFTGEEEDDKLLPLPIKRMEPRYPVDAARKGLFGYVTLRLLVDEEGKVAAVDTLDSYPKNVFEKNSIAALKQWRYQADGQKHIRKINLSFALEGGVNLTKVDKTIADYKLWDAAVAGVPQHQLVLGTLLEMVAIQSGNRPEFDASQPLSAQLDLSLFKPTPAPKAAIKGFYGYAKVSTDEKGIISKVHHFQPDVENEQPELVGQQLTGKVIAGQYSLSRHKFSRQPKINVRHLQQAPLTLSSKYWWSEAAKNGDPDAQRIMAAYHDDWEQYLLSQQHAEVMAWAGTRLLLQGQREQGLQLLDQAIAKNYQLATELKKQFL